MTLSDPVFKLTFFVFLVFLVLNGTANAAGVDLVCNGTGEIKTCDDCQVFPLRVNTAILKVDRKAATVIASHSPFDGVFKITDPDEYQIQFEGVALFGGAKKLVRGRLNAYSGWMYISSQKMKEQPGGFGAQVQCDLSKKLF